MRYATRFTDEQIVEALKAVAAKGVARQDAPDRVQPPNLAAFLANIPTPERERLIGLAYDADRPAGSK